MVKRALTLVAWPQIKALYSVLCGSSQTAVSHTLSLGLVKHFGDKFPFKILLLFPFIGLVCFFQDSEKPAMFKAPILDGPDYPGTHRDASEYKDKALSGESWTKHFFGFSARQLVSLLNQIWEDLQSRYP